jgi:hypothetical protein
MATNNSRVEALAKRIAELERRRRDAALLPDVIFLVPLRREGDGSFVEGEAVLHWHRDKKTPTELEVRQWKTKLQQRK